MGDAHGSKRFPLHLRILTGLGVGAIAGIVAQSALGAKNEGLVWFVKNVCEPTGNLFLYLIFMIVVPMLFSALVLGVSELGNAAKMGKIGLLSLVLTIVLSSIAVGLAFGGVNLVRPGELISKERRQDLIEHYADKKVGEDNLAKAKKEADDPPLLGIIPKNPAKEAARALEGGLLPFMFFALIFGLGLTAVEAEKAMVVKNFFDGVFSVTQKIMDWAMVIAPFSVAALLFRTTATVGWELFAALGVYVSLVLGLLLIHFFLTYSLALKFLAKRNPVQFMKQMKTVILTAFATSSSNATLPTALRTAEEDLALPGSISRFVLTVGATANQNGTALFEGVTIVFLAQLFGVNLDFSQQLTVMGLAIVAGIGTAGVPGGAWPMIATILLMFKVPAEAIGIVFGIDRILDMSRTVLNVYGDMTIAACVSKLSGQEDVARMEALAAID